MGSINNALRSVSGSNEEEQRVKERLEILLMAAKAKLQAYRDEINENFVNPAQVEKKQIPGIRAMKYIEQYHVATQTGFSDQVKGHLEHAIDAFFSLGEGNNKGAVKDGLKNLISGSLDAFIGSTAAGESEERTYVVIPENNAFVRVDIACWKYNFSQTKILNQHDSAVAYVLCKSVIDHTKLTIDELVYLTTEVLSKTETGKDLSPDNNILANLSVENAPNGIPDFKRQLQLMGYNHIDHVESDKTLVDIISAKFAANGSIDETKTIAVEKDGDYTYKKIREKAIENNFVTYNATSKKFEIKEYNLGFGVINKKVPASIANVEAYIEELIRVWKKLKTDRKED